MHTKKTLMPSPFYGTPYDELLLLLYSNDELFLNDTILFAQSF